MWALYLLYTATAVTGIAAVLLVLRRLISPFIGPLLPKKPIRLKSTPSGFSCRLGEGLGEIAVVCTVHQLVIVTAGMIRPVTTRIALGSILDVRADSHRGRAELVVVTAAGPHHLDARDHSVGTVEMLAERIREAAASCEVIEGPPDELLALTERP